MQLSLHCSKKRKKLLAKQLDRLLWKLPQELQDRILAWHYVDIDAPYPSSDYCKKRMFRVEPWPVQPSIQMTTHLSCWNKLIENKKIDNMCSICTMICEIYEMCGIIKIIK